MIIDSPIVSGSASASGSLNQHGDIVITGSLTVTGPITGALTGSVDSASFASTAISSSYAASATSASYAISATSSSYANDATSASYAVNASFLNGSGSGEFTPTGSFNTFSSSILTYTGSNDTNISNIHSTTASLNTASGSAITRLNSIESTTGSLNVASGSAITRLNALEVTSGSNITRISALEVASGSAITRLNALEVTSGSNITRISALESASGSAITRLNSIESTTGSLNVFSGSAQSQLTSLQAQTGSYATTGSNTFIGTQTITGSVLQSGSLSVNGCITSTGQIVAQTINVQQVTSSVVYSCGDNIFGTILSNTQTFTGSMFITGSTLTVNGGAICTTGNTCIGGTAIIAGCVGIGTASPHSNGLSIRGASDSYSLTVLQQNTNTAGYGFFAGNSGDFSIARFSGGEYTSAALKIQLNTNVVCFANTVCVPNFYMNGGIINQTSGDLSFWVPNVGQAVTITQNTGRLGIGTTSPVGKLDVALLNTRRFIVTYDDSIVTIKGASDTGAGENLRIIGDNLIFNTNSVGSGIERMRITSGGNVLVGTTTDAGYKLDVSGTGRFTGQLSASLTSSGTPLRIDVSTGGNVTSNTKFVIGTGGQAGSQANKKFLDIDFNGYLNYTFARIRSWDESSSTGQGSLYFYTNSGTTDANILALQLSHTGAATFSSSVTVNGTIPATSGKLSVLTSTSTLGATADLGLLISNDGAVGKLAQIGFGYSESRSAAVIGGVISNGSGSTTSDLFFATRSTTTGSDAPIERMRITSGGNVLIGTTCIYNTANFIVSAGSGASSTPYMGIFNCTSSPTVNASVRLDLGFLSGNSNFVATDTILGYINFMGQANDAGYGGAGIYAQVVSGGNVGRGSGHGVNLIFNTKATDTLGYNERMRITSCGKVGIGATDPRWLLEICANNACGGAGQYPAVVVNNSCACGYSAYYFYYGTNQMGGLELSNRSCDILINSINTLSLQTNNSNRLRFDISGIACFACTVCVGGHIIPTSNGTQDLGSSSFRWCTVYTSDLSLNNGIGNYTIVEGESDLFLYNNNSCKVYKFIIQEVCPEIAPAKRSI